MDLCNILKKFLKIFATFIKFPWNFNMRTFNTWLTRFPWSPRLMRLPSRSYTRLWHHFESKWNLHYVEVDSCAGRPQLKLEDVKSDVVPSTNHTEVELCANSQTFLKFQHKKHDLQSLSMNTYEGTEIPAFRRCVAGMIERAVRIILIIKK